MKKLSKIISMIMAFALVMGLALTPALAVELKDATFTDGKLDAGEYDVSSDLIWTDKGNIVLGGNTTINVKEGATLSLGGYIDANSVSLTVNGEGEGDTMGKITSTGTTIYGHAGATVNATGVAIESMSTGTTGGAVELVASIGSFEDCDISATNIGVYAMRNSNVTITESTVTGATGVTLSAAMAEIKDSFIKSETGVGISLSWNINMSTPYAEATVTNSEVSGQDSAITLRNYSGSYSGNISKYGEEKCAAADSSTVTINSATLTGGIQEATERDQNGNAVYNSVTLDEDGNPSSEHVKLGEGSTAVATTNTAGKPVITVTAPQSPVVYIPPVQPETDPADETEIDDEDVPLAGMVQVKELVGYLYEREGYELPAAPEGSTELYDYAPAMAWAVENAIVDEDVNPDEIVTVGVAEDILNAYAAVFASKPSLGFVIDGEDDDIIDDIQAVLKDFLAQLKG